MQRGYAPRYAHGHGILTACIFSEDLAGEENYYSQDAARSRSVKGKYQGHRGQRSRSLCNCIGQKVQFLQLLTYLSQIDVKWTKWSRNIILLTDTRPKYLFYKRQAVSFVNHACELVNCCSFIMPFFKVTFMLPD